MDLTQEQFEENLMAMPEEDKLSVLTVIEQSEPEGLVNFAEALGVNLIMGETEGEEAPVVEEEVALEEPVAEEVAPEEPVDPAAVAAIEGVPPAELPSVLPPPAAPEPVPERPIDQEMQALAIGDEVKDPSEISGEAVQEEPAAEVVGPIAVPGADTSGVGDDVPMTGQEGDFVLTDAAVENSGLLDIETKLRTAIDAAKEDGLEFNLKNIVKPAKQINGSVDYMASNGEIRIPKALVRYIGLDVLGKMNAAVEEKTEEKIAEQEQKSAEKTIPVRA